MSPPLRVALLDSARGGQSAALAAALRAVGHEATVLCAAPPLGGVPERVLSRRGFTGPLTPLPVLLWRLHRGSFDIAHAFSPPDALVARTWRRGRRRPVVYTVSAPLGRADLADARLRLRLLTAAVQASDLVLAADDDTRLSLARWLVTEVPAVPCTDAAAHAHLYRDLLAA